MFDPRELVDDHVRMLRREDTIDDVCDCLVKKNFRRVPILSDGEVVGIISRKDLIKYIAEPIT